MEIPIRISNSKSLKGIRCLIASRTIKKGELIESCPIIIFSEKEDELIDQTILGNYIFEWKKNDYCFVLGYGVLLNHSYNPNTLYKRDYIRKNMNFYAIREIKTGEEILINYNGMPHKKDLLDPMHIDYKY